MTMPKDMANAQTHLPPWRRRAVLRLFLVAFVAFSSIVQFGHDMKAVASTLPHTAEVQVSTDHGLDVACGLRAGSAVASHCCVASVCGPAIIAPQAQTLHIVADRAERRDPNVGVFAHTSSPLFHPPKHTVQA